MAEPEWQVAAGTPAIRVDCHDPHAVARLGRSLATHLTPAPDAERPLVLVCIGTDRSTGDSLGPLVGTNLSERPLPGLRVLGTLDEPVHAGNLDDVVRRLTEKYAGALVVAVDACLGQTEQVGTIAFGAGPVKPGAGVNKVLPAVGSLHITGTVNVGGFMEYLVLQNTRLSLVVRMARVISDAVVFALYLADAKREAKACLPALNTMT